MLMSIDFHVTFFQSAVPPVTYICIIFIWDQVHETQLHNTLQFNYITRQFLKDVKFYVWLYMYIRLS